MVMRLGFYKILLKSNEIPIFMYHRVVEELDSSYYEKNIVVTKSSFENSIKFLTKYFRVVGLEELIIKHKKLVHASVVTFDDGWSDNYHVALPIMKSFNIPATIFVPVGMVGTHQKFWFERVENIVNSIKELHEFILFFNEIEEEIESDSKNILNVEQNEILNKQKLYFSLVNYFKKLPLSSVNTILSAIEEKLKLDASGKDSLMNWNQLEEMSEGSITIGSHCVTHEILPNLNKTKKHYELDYSRKNLLSRNINYVDCIAFPNGNYDQETLNIAEEVGYKLMLSASINKCGEGESKYLAHRINVTETIASSHNLLAFEILKAKMKKKLYSYSVDEK